MCCEILLVLHVDINSGVCYTMAVNLVLSSLVVDGRKRQRGEDRGRRRRGGDSLGKLFNSCFFLLSHMVLCL